MKSKMAHIGKPGDDLRGAYNVLVKENVPPAMNNIDRCNPDR
jgi:hypothetical protein